MNFQKRLIAIFKTFVQKVFVPQCAKNQTVMNDWNKFANMISQDSMNINEVQVYVDSLGNLGSQVNPLLMQSQQSAPSIQKKQQFYNHSSVYNRKKQDTLTFDAPQDINFNPNKTFGGQKIKMPTYTNKSEYEQIARKQFTNQKQDLSKFRSTTPNIPGNIGTGYKDAPVDNAPIMLASLEKLYKSLMENQQKIQSLTQVSAQMTAGSYF